MTGLRVEERPAQAPKPKPANDLEHWRTLAIQTGERLKNAEAQLKDMRASADELRQRLTKANERREEHQARGNELQAQVVTLTVERDEALAKLANREVIKRKAWELFTELSA